MVQSTVELWRRLAHTHDRNGRNAAKSFLLDAVERVSGQRLPRAKHTKLINWRTGQVRSVGDGVVTAEDGCLIFAGDW